MHSLPSPAELYQEFFEPAIFAPLADRLVTLADPRSGERALDLACGTGVVARRLAPLVGPSGEVVAVDVNPSMLEVGRRLETPHGAVISWRQADASALELETEPFDMACCQQGLQFFDDRRAALSRLRNALVPEGRIALALWQSLERQPFFQGYVELEREQSRTFGLEEEGMAAPFSLGDADAVERLLVDAGLECVAIEEHDLEVRFPGADGFVRRMETAYAAVVPALADDPEAFEAFVIAMERRAADMVERFREGDAVAFQMPTLLVRAVRA
jgi:SAM-dependent methyltransferase